MDNLHPKESISSCPFCGGKDIRTKVSGHKVSANNIGCYMGCVTAYAYCHGCHARGPIMEIFNLDGSTKTDGRTRLYLEAKAIFFFLHGYLDVEGSNEWMLAKHGKLIRKDSFPKELE